MYYCGDEEDMIPKPKEENKVSTSTQMKNEKEAIKMLDVVLTEMNFSFDGREPGDIFVYMQEGDLVLCRFSDNDLSEQGKCRTSIAIMHPPARDIATTTYK